MNQNLKAIQELLQQNEQLSEKEKEALLKTITDADKQWGIAEFKLDSAEKAVEAQNNELEIEAALERVRAIALGMKEPADMLEVCSTIAIELDNLGVKEIRNVQTAIFYEGKGTYMNYEYYAKHNKTLITETSFTNHKMHREFAAQMIKGKGEFFTTYISKTELPDWIAYQKTTNVFIDTYLETASSLSYYWHSLGPVALGISTYEPLEEEETNLFKRFLKVFELSYTRYLDIEQAIAQARESQIQLALERVRARTMAMQHSDELKDAAALLFQQVKALGVPAYSCGYNIWEKNEKTFTSWMSTQDGSIINGVPNIPLTEDANFIRYVESKQNGEPFFVLELRGERMQEHYQYLKTIPAFKGYFDYAVSVGFDLPKTQIHHLANFSQGNLLFITLEPCPEFHDVFKRFAAVFEQTYTRFLDLQKAEAQTRESQIQLALERVRARTMAMQKQNDLLGVLDLLVEQLVKLGVNLQVANFSDGIPGGDWDLWIEVVADDGTIFNNNVHFPRIDHPYFHHVEKNIEAFGNDGTDFFKDVFSKEEKDSWLDYIYTQTIYKDLTSEEIKQSIYDKPGYTWSMVILKNTWVSICRFNTIPFSDDEDALLRRFANAFGQAYTRFLDLQNAEAQARESQIQLALERVRARTMAMQKSDELSEAVYVLFQQFKELGENPDQATIGVINEDEKVIEYWVTMYGKPINKVFKFSIDEPNVTGKIYKAWKENKRSLMIDLSGDALTEFMTYRAGKGGAAINPGEKRRIINVAFFSKGLLNVQSNEERSKESIKLLERFASVFEQTYTRFLDLQKAEAQAREAQIEAALERVRSRTIAMQRSEDLFEVIREVNAQLQLLNFRFDSADFLTDYSDKGYKLWVASVQESFTKPFYITAGNTKISRLLKEAMERGDDFFTFTLNREEKNKHFEHVFQALVAKDASDKSKQFIYDAEGMAVSCFVVKNIILSIANFACIPYKDAENEIIRRFAFVFEQTYTRFLDLQKAEAQAREAQIETALEKVRSRSLAMHKSEELQEVVHTVFEKLKELNVDLYTAIIFIFSEGSKDVVWWLANKANQQYARILVPYADNPYLKDIFDAKESGKDFFAATYSFEEKNELFHHLFEHTDFKYVPEPQKKFLLESERATMSVALAKNTGINITSYSRKSFSESDNEILKRFAKVFDQAYTRFLDLQKAEAQAREAIKRASVDRVRAEIASMRTTSDLERITPLIWNELTTLGVPFVRCGVFIMDDEQQQVNTLLSTPDGKAIAAFHLSYNTPGEIAEIIASWRKKEMYKQHWDEAQFIEFTQNLLQQGAVTTGEKYLTENRPTDLYLHFLPFLQGMLYAGNTAPLSDDELQLMQNLADAFSTAYARYEDFNKLEEAKSKIEATLGELKATQHQLIQSEKMASLGELTAGIAHEIQNPLNFVNNFSEVNQELISELVDEVDKGNIDEVKAIAKDIKENEQKINNHGKRADAIVKGMLQHSRKSEGKKEPTDINALCDEYLRLSYHGLRAKDKSFNADFKTDFDEGIGKINVVQQDIGRVLLNLFNNAFYAINEKSKKMPGFVPVVTVVTKKLNDKVEIIVSDNGNGIPQNIIDKIFQPFFTTKPTGSGTGLGLSLSYDIIKVHGGEIKVETKEGEGTEFIIQLPA